MTDGPINLGLLKLAMMGNAAAKISKMASSKETKLDQYLETANVLELADIVLESRYYLTHI
jgi:hypothetical protein